MKRISKLAVVVRLTLAVARTAAAKTWIEDRVVSTIFGVPYVVLAAAEDHCIFDVLHELAAIVVVLLGAR